MKTARIGTILPWGGDGSEGFTASNIPKGWAVCDGQEADANESTSPAPRTVDKKEEEFPF